MAEKNAPDPQNVPVGFIKKFDLQRLLKTWPMTDAKAALAYFSKKVAEYQAYAKRWENKWILWRIEYRILKQAVIALKEMVERDTGCDKCRMLKKSGEVTVNTKHGSYTYKPTWCFNCGRKLYKEDEWE